MQAWHCNLTEPQKEHAEGKDQKLISAFPQPCSWPWVLLPTSWPKQLSEKKT